MKLIEAAELYGEHRFKAPDLGLRLGTKPRLVKTRTVAQRAENRGTMAMFH